MIAFPSFWDIFGNMAWPLIKVMVLLFLLGIVVNIIPLIIKTKAFKYFIRKNKVEFNTLIFTVIGYILSYVFVTSPGLAFTSSVAITFIATLVLIHSKTNEKDFYFMPLQRSADKEDWMGNGIFQYERAHGVYAITESHSGFIFSKCLTWNDYSFEFDFKILNTSVGAIMRATNLSNLVMMQIFKNKIQPHIRINGFWQTWTPEECGLVFKKDLNMDKWYHCSFNCDKGSIRIIISNDQKQRVFDRVWKIPAGHIVFSLPKESGLIAQSVISSFPFPINLEYGSIGFRNDGEEKALVKNVLIERLQGQQATESL